MSTLVAQTISNGTVSTSSANVIQGSAKAWVNFNGISGASIRSSYNVSSVTFNSTGLYTINFTNAMPNANYFVGGSATSNGSFSGASSSGVLCEYKSAGTTYGNKTTTAIQVATIDNNGDTLYDSFSTNVAIFSN